MFNKYDENDLCKSISQKNEFWTNEQKLQDKFCNVFARLILDFLLCYLKKTFLEKNLASVEIEEIFFWSFV